MGHQRAGESRSSRRPFSFAAPGSAARRATDMVRATILAGGSALAAALAVSVVYAGHGSTRGRATPPYITRAVGDSARPEADTKRDADRHPALTLAFAGVKPGDQVAELIPGSGYFTRLLSAVVGPKGKVYAVAPPRRPDAPADQPDPAARLQPITSDSHYSNVTVSVQKVAQLERSEEHTSELQSQSNLVCRLLL